MDARVPTAARVDPPRGAADTACPADWVCALIEARQTILPKRLAEPGPDAAQLQQIFSAAAAAPDHGERMPWRFVLIPRSTRERLAQVFVRSLLQRDPAATAEQQARASEKAHRAPTLVLAVAGLSRGADDEIPDHERLVSAGCAIQNMLLAATAMGFGSALTSGKAMSAPALRALFSLRDHEQALCFISIGTAVARKPRRKRPDPADYVSVLEPIQ